MQSHESQRKEKIKIKEQDGRIKVNTPIKSWLKRPNSTLYKIILKTRSWSKTKKLEKISVYYAKIEKKARDTIFSSVQSLSHVRLFATLRTAARQAFLSITNSRSLPKPLSIVSVMPSNHLILCHPLLLLPSIFPSIRVFSN